MVTVITSTDSKPADNDGLVRRLLDCGWGVEASQNGIVLYEPRTRLALGVIDASKILERHLKDKTKPVAVSVGSTEHAICYNKWGAPEASCTITVNLRHGSTLQSAVSVWFPTEKEVEKYLSEAGHRASKK